MEGFEEKVGSVNFLIVKSEVTARVQHFQNVLRAKSDITKPKLWTMLLAPLSRSRTLGSLVTRRTLHSSLQHGEHEEHGGSVRFLSTELIWLTSADQRTNPECTFFSHHLTVSVPSSTLFDTKILPSWPLHFQEPWVLYHSVREWSRCHPQGCPWTSETYIKFGGLWMD